MKRIDRNEDQNKMRIQNETKILHTLLETPTATYKELKEKIGIKTATIYKYLNRMVEEGLIEYTTNSQHKRAVKITKKGLKHLNKIDTGTKTNIFVAQVFEHLNLLFQHAWIFDYRLQKEDFNRLYNKFAEIYDYAKTHPHNIKKVHKQVDTLEEDYFEALKRLGVDIENTPPGVTVRSEFIDLLRNLIGDLALFIATRGVESKDASTSHLFKAMCQVPVFIASRIQQSLLDIQPFKDGGLWWGELEWFAESSREITPKNYNEMLEIYKSADVAFLLSVGGEFKEMEIDALAEFVKNVDEKS